MLAYFSYAHNGWRVIPQAWFTSHQVDSEQLVLDGLLHARSAPDDVGLGQYTRPGVDNARDIARELYASGDTGGEFKHYRSQFGLQAHAFRVLAANGLDNLQLLHSLVAAIMSAVATGMVWCIRRDFSNRAAWAVAAVLVFSPWLVVFSRNLYWVSFTWYLPLLASMWIGPATHRNKSNFVWLLGLLFGLYLIKLLCGYEYLTTIFIAACVPLIYSGIRYGLSLTRIAGRLLAHGVVFLAAFLSAMAIHSISLDSQGVSGLSQILLTAQKRMKSSNAGETARAACEGDNACEKEMIESLNSNPVKVAARYFVVLDFLPWASLATLDNATKDFLKSADKSRGFHLIQDIRKTIGDEKFISLIVYLMAKLISVLAFLGFLFLLAFRFRSYRLEIRTALLASLLAPLSWYVLVKGHSQIHYHLNYVLWYLPFVLIGVIALADPRKPRNDLAG